MAARNTSLRPPTSISHRPKGMILAAPIPTSTHAPRRFGRGKRHSSKANRMARSGSRGQPRSLQTSTPSPCAHCCAIASATGWLQTNHPLWLMQLGGAACDSPPGVDELLGLGLADSARQIVIDRNGAFLCLKACRLARLARRSPSIVSTRQPTTLGVTAGSRSLRPCCGRGSAGRMVGYSAAKWGTESSLSAANDCRLVNQRVDPQPSSREARHRVACYGRAWRAGKPPPRRTSGEFRACDRRSCVAARGGGVAASVEHAGHAGDGGDRGRRAGGAAGA